MPSSPAVCQKSQVRFSGHGPGVVSGVPVVVFYFRAFVPDCQIKGLASAFKQKACVGNHAAAGHGVQDMVARFCEVIEGVGNELGRNPKFSPGSIQGG